MLSDDELAALRDIERRLYRGSPELFRLFDSVEPQPATNHRKPARTRVLIAAVALSGLALRGPRMLSATEVRTLRRQPPSRTARADSALAERTDLVADPAGPVEELGILPARSITVRAPSYGSYTEEGPSHLDWVPEHVESPSQEVLVFPQIAVRARERVPTAKARAELERK
ncbi:DUF3040 domain-containing protein [Mycobacterium sp. 29Ha]|uniref:DUF3040 domain-containing protein n=1 Tax=Mycobacterium sp. 29Ha TaxID=2939268 RepID=UPI0039777151